MWPWEYSGWNSSTNISLILSPQRVLWSFYFAPESFIRRLDLANSRDSSLGSRYLEMSSISTKDVAFDQEKPGTTDQEQRMVSDFFLHFRIKLSKWRRCKAKFSAIYVLSVGEESFQILHVGYVSWLICLHQLLLSNQKVQQNWKKEYLQIPRACRR